MRSNTKNLRPIFGLIFCGILLIAPSIGELSPAAGVWRLRTHGRIRATRRHSPSGPQADDAAASRRSGVDRPPRTNGGSLANEGSRGPGHHGIIGRGRGGFHYGGDGGGNYAGGVVPVADRAPATATTTAEAALAAECRRAESAVLSLTK